MPRLHPSTARIGIPLTLLMGAVLQASPSGAADVPNLKEYRITTATGAHETTPTIGNDGVSDLIVFTMRVVLPNGTWAPGDIWYLRIREDGEPFGPAWQVTSEDADDQLNDVSGDYIVYTAYESTSSSRGAIRLYRISTHETVPLAEAEIMREPRIYGNNVVWVEGPSLSTRVMWYDIGWLGTSEEARLLAGPVPPAEEVAIGSRYVVWTQYAGGQWDIWGADFVTMARVQITRTSGADETQPATSGEWAAWQTQEHGATSISIEAMNLVTRELRTVASNGAYNVRPSIDGDLIAWEAPVSGTLDNWDIFLHRLSDQQTFQVTADPADQFLNDVFGNKVAFTDLRNGSQDIYVASYNRSPVANAGADQAVHAGSVVTLDGAASTDPDLNYPLTYAWTLKQRPPGSAASLAGADTATPSFTADVMGEYLAELVVTDVFGWPSLPDTVAVSTTNSAPVAAAGPDQAVVLLGSTVQLEGHTSYDPDGDPIAYHWVFVGRPTGSGATLSEPGAADPTFVPDLYGRYDLSLTVTDPFDSSSSDAVTVSFENVKPVADAGFNQTVTVPSTVWLDGRASRDANDDPLTFQWSLVSRPDGTAAELSGPTTTQPSFDADRAGQYVVSLVVSDGLLASDPCNVTITATSSSEEAIEVLRAAAAEVNGLEPASFKNPNLTNALTSKIAALVRMIEEGRYAEALDKLSHDVLPKTDGCATVGAPDKNDWITDCAAQAQVYPYLLEVRALLEHILT